MLDGGTVRFALLATAPFLFCVSLFFSLQVRARALVVLFSLILLTLFTQVITNISYVLGPVAQFHENSRFYSAVAPKPNPEVDNRLPHITIQMPVYKESLKETMCVFYLLFFLVLFLLSAWVWARTCITGFHVDDRWDLRAQRDLRGIAVSPLGLGGEIAIAALLGSWNEAGGLIETRCFDAVLLPVALDGMQMRDGDGD